MHVNDQLRNVHDLLVVGHVNGSNATRPCRYAATYVGFCQGDGRARRHNRNGRASASGRRLEGEISRRGADWRRPECSKEEGLCRQSRDQARAREHVSPYVLCHVSTLIDYCDYDDRAHAAVGPFARVCHLIRQIVVIDRRAQYANRHRIMGAVIARRLLHRFLSYRTVNRQRLKVFFGFALRIYLGRMASGHGACGCGPGRRGFFVWVLCWFFDGGLTGEGIIDRFYPGVGVLFFCSNGFAWFYSMLGREP